MTAPRHQINLCALEEFTYGKNNKEPCEDLIFKSEDYVAVIDGATTPSPTLIEKSPSGLWAALTVYNALKKLPKEAKSRQAIQFISHFFNVKLKESEPGKLSDALRPTVSGLIIYSKHHHELWSVGDTSYMLGHVAYANTSCVHFAENIKLTKGIDEFHAKIRSIALHQFIKEYKGSKEEAIHMLQQEDIGQNMILPQIKEQYLHANNVKSRQGYGCINGKNVPEQFVQCIPLDPSVREIILASDGYPQLFPTLAATEAALAALLKRDPLMINEYKSTKGLQKGNNSFDDRAYIHFKITP